MSGLPPTLAGLAGGQRGVFVPRVLIRLTGHLPAAALLAQLIHLQANAVVELPPAKDPEGRRWVAKADTEWFEECGVTRKQARAIAEGLEAQGFACTVSAFHRGRTVRHWALNLDALEDALFRAARGEAPVAPSGPDEAPVAPSGRDVAPSGPDSKEETPHTHLSVEAAPPPAPPAADAPAAPRAEPADASLAKPKRPARRAQTEAERDAWGLVDGWLKGLAPSERPLHEKGARSQAHRLVLAAMARGTAPELIARAMAACGGDAHVEFRLRAALNGRVPPGGRAAHPAGSRLGGGASVYDQHAEEIAARTTTVRRA